MGSGASTGLTAGLNAAVSAASDSDIARTIGGLSSEGHSKLKYGFKEEPFQEVAAGSNMNVSKSSSNEAVYEEIAKLDARKLALYASLSDLTSDEISTAVDKINAQNKSEEEVLRAKLKPDAQTAFMDQWKRQYSNNDTPDAAKWLWENWDPEQAAWYKFTDKYTSERVKAWMAADMMGNFVQLWKESEFAKTSFGIILLCGEDKPGNILVSGYFMFCGKTPPDWSALVWSQMFNIEPCDPIGDMACRKRLVAYLSWGEYGLTADLDGDCLDGKLFK